MNSPRRCVASPLASLWSATASGEMPSSSDCLLYTSHARAAFEASRIEDIWLIGRRGPLEASFTTAELAEFGDLSRVATLVDPAQLPQAIPEGLADEQRKLAEKNLEVLRAYVARGEQCERPLRLHFVFHAAPVAIQGEGRARELLSLIQI